MNHQPANCADIEAKLAEYFEGTLDGAQRSVVDAHASVCLPCGSLIRDIESIREDAVSMPSLTPSRDLWTGIESRIQSPVVSIEPKPSVRAVSRRWLAAAAMLLVASTSAVTYLATSRSLGDRGPAPGGAVDNQVAATVEESSSAEPEDAGRLAASPPAAAPRSDKGGVLASSSNATELPYDGEIRRLQFALVERRAQLDPATVAIVEDNLKLIDTAVRQARAALAGDPANGFLSGQLNSVLEKKIELLRTAALLPSRS